jgi:signal transduction histidine kinase
MFLLGGLLAVLLAGLLILQGMERREADLTRAEAQQSRVQMLNHWLDLASRSLPQAASELAQSEGMARVAARPETADRRTLAAELASLNVQALWMLGEDGIPFFQGNPAGANEDERPLPPPLSDTEFKTLVAETPSPRFFAEQGGALFEVCIRRLSGGTDRPWLLVAHRWDDAHLKTLSGLTESDVALVSAHDTAHAPAAGLGSLVLLRALNDWQGNPLRTLRLEYADPAVDSLLKTHSWQAWLFILFGLLVLGALGLAMQRWVLRPLGQISHSLAHDDTTPIRILTHEKNELGRVARLVETSFAQREELRRSIEDRARLGRDLHDGIIQSLYAAGMGLATVRNLLPPGQAEANARLEQTRAALNETIRDVRNFISGLEPEALKQQSFTHAVVALLDFLQSIRPVRTSVDIDEHVATLLSLSQRVHALQIAREAVSNAIRHGEARHVRVSMQSVGTTAEFEIRDDGKGFDPSSRNPEGRGLENFSRRARDLGAEFVIDSAPGKGTRIKLSFPLPS